MSNKNGKGDKDDTKESSSSSSSGPRLEARFGKLGAFVDRLGDEMGEELKKNKDIQEGLKELNKLKEDGMKQTEAFRDQKVGGKSVEEQATAAQEKAKEAADMASKAADEARLRAEEISKKAEGVTEEVRKRGEKLSDSWSKLREKVTDKASEQYESSEFAKAKYEEMESAKDKVTNTSWFSSVSAAISETLAEAKDDLLGDSGRGSDGRLQKPRRRVKPHEAAWRQKMANFEQSVQGGGGEEEGNTDDGERSKDVGKDADGAAAAASASQNGTGDIETESEWASAVDPESGDTYYYNTMTGATSWEKPEEATADEADAGAGADTSTSANDDVEEGSDGQPTTEGDEATDYTGRTGGVEVVKDRESTWEQVKEFLTKTPIIQDILGASSQQARRFGKTETGKAARKRMRKAGNAIEDAREVWETSQNPYIYQLASAYDAVFAETEEGQAIKELRRLDRDFVLEDWLQECEDDFAPDMLQAYLTGDESLMKGLCGDTAKAMVSAFIAERKKNGFVVNPTILDIGETNLLAARVFEKAPPIMVVQFQAQQIHCVTDKHGEVVEGNEDAITNNFYVLAMQRDWDEEENELRWKIVEFMILGSVPYQ
jgi:import inner membrane translocase subunit TIM44